MAPHQISLDDAKEGALPMEVIVASCSNQWGVKQLRAVRKRSRHGELVDYQIWRDGVKQVSTEILENAVDVYNAIPI